MSQILSGASAAVCLFIGIFFLRFWRTSRDRLFLVFAVAFGVFSLHWALLGLADVPNESRHYFYLLRLLAFVLIIGGVIDKNRRPNPR
ncbi:MAG: DUF5985 family protein [Acidobacteriota bacterium]